VSDRDRTLPRLAKQPDLFEYTEPQAPEVKEQTGCKALP
jgi:hypothetical protein